MDLENLPEKPAAEPFVDSLPPPAEDPPPASVPVGPYHPIPFLLPRYWSPTVETVNQEWRYGVFTGSNDPLAQHAYLLEVLRGTATNRTDSFVVYQYDRFWPTFSVAAQDVSDPEAGGAIIRSREVDLGVSLPVQRSFRMAQAFSLTWRRKREDLENVQTPARLDLGGLEVGYDLASAKIYPYSISPTDGFRLHIGYLLEDPEFGGQVSLGKLTMDSRDYQRVGSDSVLALRLGGGMTFGHPRFAQSYAVGGFPEGTLSDVIDTNFTVLRGYPDDAFFGRSFVHANAEFRFPLFLPEHGYRSLPVLLRHLHGAVFVDAANAWVGPFRFRDLHPGVGAALGMDLAFAQAYPLTLTSGVARGLSSTGVTTYYVRLGVAF
jgi:hypothetical protein